MKIWHQSLTTLSDVSPYRIAIEGHMRRLARPGTEIVMHGIKPGTYKSHYPGQYVGFAYIQYFHTLQFLKAVVRAERENFDAFIIATFPDSGLYEARSAVDIPVVGIGEAAMHVASMLGERFSVIGFVEPMLKRYEANARRYGFGDRIGPSYAVEVSFDELMAAYDDPSLVIERIEVAGRQAIANGADVLIPADGPLNAVIRTAGLSRLADVPVVDTFGAAIKMAEMMADLRSLSGVYVNRRNSYFYARPPAEFVDDVLQRYGGADWGE